MNEEDKSKVDSVNGLWNKLLSICRDKDSSLGNKKEIFALKTKE
jgi:hypothetical protein